MHEAIVTLNAVMSEVLEVATDERSVWLYNQQYGTEGLSSFVFLKNGDVYGCDYSELVSTDKLYRVK